MKIIWTIFFIVLAFYITISAIEKIYYKVKGKKKNGKPIDRNSEQSSGNDSNN